MFNSNSQYYTDDGHLTDDRYNIINAWFDEKGYWDTRGIVNDALDNNLKEGSPECPFSAREVVLWAFRYDEETVFMTAAGQSISGQSMTHWLVGSPKVDPVTGDRNSMADQRGVIGEAVYETKKMAMIGAAVTVAAGVGYLFLKPYLSVKAKKFAK